MKYYTVEELYNEMRDTGFSEHQCRRRLIMKYKEKHNLINKSLSRGKVESKYATNDEVFYTMAVTDMNRQQALLYIRYNKLQREKKPNTQEIIRDYELYSKESGTWRKLRVTYIDW